MTRRRICLLVSYDGGDYVGWQWQPNGISVQQRIEEALQLLTGTAHRVHSSGRTDAGVHARGMVCHFDSDSPLPLRAFREGLNSYLPDTIAVVASHEVDADFHARFSATAKHYRYTLLCSQVRLPLERQWSWHVKQALDIEAMQRAAGFFVGNHDFSAFRTSGCAAATTERRIFALTLKIREPLLLIDVVGSGFLKNMVRMMVGTLVEVGRGKRNATEIRQMLAGPGGHAPALTAPAHGLCLMSVYYRAYPQLNRDLGAVDLFVNELT